MGRRKILSEIATGNIGDFIEISEDGQTVTIKKQVKNSPAVEHIRTEQKMLGKYPVQVTKLGLMNKIAAIDLLNKMDKIYSDVSLVNQDNRTINIIVMDQRTKDLMARVHERTGKLIEGEVIDEPV